jgi:hypothetical protein
MAMSISFLEPAAGDDDGCFSVQLGLVKTKVNESAR